MIANTVAMLLALAALSGCAAPAPGTMAPQTAAPEVAAPASAEGARVDRTVTLPSGATLKVAADWTVTTSTDGLILEDPEKQLKIELVEVEATAGMSAAISTAWSRRHPGFNRQELAASDSPGREGWDLFRWSRYKTSPEEARRVSAFVARKDTLAVVVLVDSPSRPSSDAAPRSGSCTTACVPPATSAKRTGAERPGRWTRRAWLT